jgi:hypothetical protein
VAIDAARFVAEHSTRLKRLVNASDMRRAKLTVRITQEALRRLETLAQEWQGTVCGVAGEVLDAAVCEVWAAMERGREGAR